MELAYFSEIRNRITSYLDNANKIVQVAMAWFTSNELFSYMIDVVIEENK